MQSVKQSLDIPERNITFHIQGFASESDMVETAQNSLRSLDSNSSVTCINRLRFYAGVVFQFKDITLTKQLQYQIRFPNVKAPSEFNGFEAPYCTCQPPIDGYDTDKQIPAEKWKNPGPREPNEFDYGEAYTQYRRSATRAITGWDYYTIGFTMLQHAVDRSMIRQVGKELSKPTTLLDNLSVNMQRMPHPSYKKSELPSNLSSMLLSLLMAIAFITSGLYAAKAVIAENENQTREYMTTMGLSNSCWWLSHFVFAFVKQLLVMVVSSIILCYWKASKGQSTLPLTSFSVLLVLLLLWAICIILMAYTTINIFSKASRVTNFILLFWMLSLFPSFLVSVDSDSVFTLCLACLLLNSAMYIGFTVIMMLEMQTLSLGWTSISQGLTPNTNFSFAHVLCMLLVQILLYLIVIWLADGNSYLRRLITVATHRVGSQMDSGKSAKHVSEDNPRLFALSNRRSSSGHRSSRVEGYNESTDEPKPSIHIHNLRKTFHTGTFGMQSFTAVDRLSFDVMPNQLTVLLGHNGAGKSTTFAMLTGSLKPSEGHVEIAGYDLLTEFNQINERMGFCPQHNVLFNELTVIDHLKFFCQLKNRQVDDVEIDELIVLLSLSEKRDAKAGTLSGGQKRKLSVGIALVGRSEIVLLDEPSSGVDAQTRHEFWKLLQQEKARRTILMTTHYMEEADVLGDRIVIMTNGKLHCAGTSMFLKRKYGAGYHLIVDYQSERAEMDLRNTLQLLQTQCARQDIQLESVTATQATFLLPYEARPTFATCLHALGVQQQFLHITSFGVSVTTLEEVFLKVGQEALSKDQSSIETGNTIEDLTVMERLTGWPLYVSQMRGLLYKRAHCWVQGGFGGCLWLCANVLFLSLMLAFTIESNVASRVALQSESTLSLTPDMFDQPVISTFYTNATNPDLWKAYAESTSKYASTSQIVDVDRAEQMVSKTSSMYLDQYTKMEWGQAFKRVVVGAAFMGSVDIPHVQAWYSGWLPSYSLALLANNSPTSVVGEPYHALPVSLGLIDQSLLQLVMQDSSYSLLCVNHPLPPVDLRFKSGTNILDSLADSPDYINVLMRSILMPITALLLVVFSIVDFTARFTTVVAEERQSGMMHLQYATGVSPLLYWGTHFLFDYAMLFLPALAFYILFAVFEFNGFFVGTSSLCYWLLFLLFGWAQIPSRYLLTAVVKRPSRAMLASTVIGLLSGVIFFSVAFVFHVMVLLPFISGGSNLPDWVNHTEVFLRLIGSIFSPVFNFAYCIFELYFLGSLRSGCAQYIGKTNPSDELIVPESLWEIISTIPPILRASTDPLLGLNEFWWTAGVGFPLLMLLAQGCVFWFILLAIDYRLFTKLRGKQNKQQQSTVSTNKDIAAEQKRVQHTDPAQLMIAVSNLSKTFTKKQAVQNVSFGVSAGECFGLLGVNGAGKTTTFKMLTGQLPIQDGSVHLNGQSVHHNWQQACTVAGYCPQFEAVLEQLTGKHLLSLFARLRGIPELHVAQVTRNVLQAVDITRYRNRPFSKYSGGTKRRCSIGLALIGVPAALMLDEPTTGVDPVARRALWDILRHLKDSDLHKVAILLTSHSMEECDALCDRLSIMMQGQFSCLGSPQYLKSRFGTAFTLNIRLRDDHQFQSVNQAICNNFQGAICTQRHHTSLSYSVPTVTDQVHNWASLFGVMERVSEEQGLEDYNLSQATLEDVFLAFSTDQVGQVTKPDDDAVQLNQRQPLHQPRGGANNMQMQFL